MVLRNCDEILTQPYPTKDAFQKSERKYEIKDSAFTSQRESCFSQIKLRGGLPIIKELNSVNKGGKSRGELVNRGVKSRGESVNRGGGIKSRGDRGGGGGVKSRGNHAQGHDMIRYPHQPLTTDISNNTTSVT